MELTAREHEVAALECDAIAAYLENLADLADGPLGPNIALAHRATALTVQGRAARHRECADGSGNAQSH